jgi:hypothetical protein
MKITDFIPGIDIHILSYVVPDGLFYPNVYFFDRFNNLYKPSQEQVMSLKAVKPRIPTIKPAISRHVVDPVFCFVYNTDNYFHFVYDSIPYLISYLHLKAQFPNLKLLVNYPNYQSKKIYRFVKEFFDIMEIKDSDLEFIQPNTEYSTVFVSDSYTFPETSKYAYTFFRNIKNKVVKEQESEKIYISRRSHIHGDISNIGTNYTTRRQMVNEDELVNYLTSKGYREVFTETMTVVDVINLFANAEHIVGPIGGGMVNCLFSQAPRLTITSPGFLDVNERFKGCLGDTEYFNYSSHVEDSKFKSNMRVKCGDIVGEVVSVNNSELLINYTDYHVAGWNNEVDYKMKLVKAEDCEPLDNGLNSPWKIDLEKFKETYELHYLRSH